jgi:periplasmic divalent cation tolerance protein
VSRIVAGSSAGENDPHGVVVLITAPDEEAAKRVAHGLVNDRLAACVNVIGGVRSIYRWENKVADDREQLLVVKTWSDRLEALKKKVLEGHPYDVPEIVALPIQDGHTAYLDWVMQETR